jgi:carboxyl-terminal processing protease
VAETRADDLGRPTVINKMVAKLVTKLMQDDHLSNRPLDDQISQRAFDLFVKSLDPMKVYFSQSDIDEFSVWRTDLDDEMKRGDFTAAFAIFRRFLQRVDQRTETAVKMVDMEHDFTVKEEMVTDSDLLTFAATEEEAIEKWRKRIKYSLLVFRDDESRKDKESEKEDEDSTDDSSGDDEGPKNVKKAKKKDPKEVLRKRYRSFARRMHQTNAEEVIEMFVSAVTNAFDPHTTYMSSKTFENFRILLSLQLEGIGATLSMTDDGYTVIKSIVPGGACDTQGGIKVEDKIVAVAQGNEDGTKTYKKLYDIHGGEPVDVVGMKLDEVVGMIRGRAGTVVRLSVISENSEEIHEVKISREKIKLEDSAAKGAIFEEGTREDGSPKKIGVIDLPSFYADMSGKLGGRRTTVDVERILNDFNSKNVDAVVLDLRRNGGGSLKEAIDLTGLFIDEGTVVQVKDSYDQITKYDDETPGLSWEKPVIVLTSKFSASASEILAGALQDYGRGIIVGDTTTHGKGTVQSLLDLNQIVANIRNPPNTYGALKITMQQFYRPSGESTQLRGVLADLVLPSLSDKMDVGESDLEYAVEFDKIPGASHDLYQLASPQLKETLRQKSVQRIDSSEDFAKRKRQIENYVSQKALKKVSLNEEEFMARRKELSAEKEDEKTIEALEKNEIERDFFMDEVLKITSDYVELLGANG